MLEYDRIDISEVIDVNKINVLRECIICYPWYFFVINFIFQSKVCDDCHNLMQKAISFNDAAIVSVKQNDYRIHFLYISKDEAINLLRSTDLTR